MDPNIMPRHSTITMSLALTVHAQLLVAVAVHACAQDEHLWQQQTHCRTLSPSAGHKQGGCWLAFSLVCQKLPAVCTEHQQCRDQCANAQQTGIDTSAPGRKSDLKAMPHSKANCHVFAGWQLCRAVSACKVLASIPQLLAVADTLVPAAGLHRQ